jgi:hypothetical protein
LHTFPITDTILGGLHTYTHIHTHIFIELINFLLIFATNLAGKYVCLHFTSEKNSLLGIYLQSCLIGNIKQYRNLDIRMLFILPFFQQKLIER